MNQFRQTSIKPYLIKRAKIIQAVHQFFIDNDYLEVDTPCRIPAPAPEAHIDSQASGEWFLQTSPELCMKRLLAAGYSRIFQITKCFRENERGARHIPELAMLEWYCTHITYLELMDQCEDLICFAARACGNQDAICFQEKNIDLSKPWDRMSVSEAFEKYAPISMTESILKDSFDEIIGCEIEPNLGLDKPLFLYDYPASKAALSRLKPDDPGLAERFELYIGGIELCNAFTELIDPVEQKKRFEEEQQHRKSMGKPVYPMPDEFLKALEFMPPAAGNALGLDRLVMILTDTAKIDDVVAFTPEEL